MVCLNIMTLPLARPLLLILMMCFLLVLMALCKVRILRCFHLYDLFILIVFSIYFVVFILFSCRFIVEHVVYVLALLFVYLMWRRIAVFKGADHTTYTSQRARTAQHTISLHLHYFRYYVHTSMCWICVLLHCIRSLDRCCMDDHGAARGGCFASSVGKV